ncbi:RICIN domain-containing protein [Streptomyces sp. 058-1L]|uniref:RICIN domain-containing protein n=1 Tax=Streptomyces sp. 058-1L TaxID=2789266 RepID=UPI00397F78F5
MFNRDRRSMRLVFAAVAALTAALVANVLPGAAVAAPGPPNRLGPVQIQNAVNGLAVDAEAGDMEEGRKILQFTYGGRHGQQWWFEAATGSSYYLKSNVNGAYCIGLDGTLVVLKLCGGDGTTWEFDQVQADTYLLKTPGGDQYLTSPTTAGGKSNSGVQLTLGSRTEADTGRGHWHLTDLVLEEYTPPADPRLDQATFLTTHNAFNSYGDGFVFPNQSRSMATQLDEGVRGMMLDVYDGSEPEDPLRMCHGTCVVGGNRAFQDGLADIVTFLQRDADAVVTVFIEDRVTDRAKMASEMAAIPGLKELVFDPEVQEVATHGWPTLSQMKGLDKRLLIFSDHSDVPEVGVRLQRNWTVENFWSMGGLAGNKDCYTRWDEIPLTRQEPGFTRLFVMNQFRDAPTAITAAIDNGDSLVDRALNICGPAARKTPNYVAVDFYELPLGGSTHRAIETIGRHRYTFEAATNPNPPSQLLSAYNRKAQLPGMPNWSAAGYRGGSPLPGEAQHTGDEACRITPEELDGTYGVKPDDEADDSAGLQRAIDDIRTRCGGAAQFERLSLITLPAGKLNVSRQIAVDASYLTIRGQGSDPARPGGTRIVYRPDDSTKYDTLTSDGSRWDQDAMSYGSGADTGKGGWMWPGRGLFRVSTREVAPRYADELAAAPANRKDLFEGSVNQHWASGVKLRTSAAAPGFSAKEGDRVVHLDAKADPARFPVGGHVWVGAANSRKFYALQSATDEGRYENLHMRQQVFRISSVDAAHRTLTLDKPLEFDLPVDSTSDGSAAIDGTIYPSKVTPLKMVVGVGFENFSFTQDMPGMTPEQARHNYGNLAPAYAMHGLVFKWAADSWARGVRAEMTGSHPIVTEVAKNLQFERNHLDGAWNKGKGGNGYFRGSRVWDSLYALNTTRNLRHFTLQWSASGNVVYGNDFDSDLNLHGGWERRNLFENNTVRVPYEHYSGNCTARCGGEGGDVEAGTWYPIWWAAGAKALKWSGSSGPQNVFHNNTLSKQLTPGGPYTDYLPYGKTGVGAQPLYQFGSAPGDPSRFQHLTQGGSPIADWNGREKADFTAGAGVDSTHTAPLTSVFLRNAG